MLVGRATPPITDFSCASFISYPVYAGGAGKRTVFPLIRSLGSFIKRMPISMRLIYGQPSRDLYISGRSSSFTFISRYTRAVLPDSAAYVDYIREKNIGEREEGKFHPNEFGEISY